MADRIGRTVLVASRDSASRFFNIPLVEFRGRYFPDLSSFKLPDPNVQDGAAVLPRAGRLDLVAEAAYQDPTLLWLLVAANDIEDPIALEAGLVLRVPSVDFLTALANRRV